MTNDRFTALVRQYERLIYTICLQLVRDPAAAEDLTQDTFLSAYLHRDAIPPDAQRQYLARIAANKAKDYLQSAWNRRAVFPEGDSPASLLPFGTAPPAEEIALRRSAAGEIAQAIQAMKEPYRQVCRLCLLEERTPEEAARVLDRPVKTVYTQLARAKRLLREQMERSGGHGSLSR